MLRRLPFIAVLSVIAAAAAAAAAVAQGCGRAAVIPIIRSG